jgi:sortase A
MFRRFSMATSNDNNDNKVTAMKLVLRGVQHLLLVAGVLLVGVYVGRSLNAVMMSHIAAKKFAEGDSSPNSRPSADLPPRSAKRPDVTLWSEKRVAAYEEALSRYFDPPIALIRIRRLKIEAPIFEGVDELTLDRGVGHIPGTALPGQDGNLAVAGHRDGFFRPLKDIAPQDEVEVLTASKKETYTVDQIVLVSPKDVSVLEPGSARSLTLVTCFPFYFIGSAPKRYIVKALLTKSEVTPVTDERKDAIATALR